MQMMFWQRFSSNAKNLLGGKCDLSKRFPTITLVMPKRFRCSRSTWPLSTPSFNQSTMRCSLITWLPIRVLEVFHWLCGVRNTPGSIFTKTPAWLCRVICVRQVAYQPAFLQASLSAFGVQSRQRSRKCWIASVQNICQTLEARSLRDGRHCVVCGTTRCMRGGLLQQVHDRGVYSSPRGSCNQS